MGSSSPLPLWFGRFLKCMISIDAFGMEGLLSAQKSYEQLGGENDSRRLM